MLIFKNLKMNQKVGLCLKTFCAFFSFLVMQLSYHVLDNLFFSNLGVKQKSYIKSFFCLFKKLGG
jgi:hypothetical protein